MPRRLPSLVALRAFEAAARLGSAKRAADELSVTPTAISHQLRALEDALAMRLFVRRPRQLAVTREGRELQQALGHAFDAMAEAIARLRPATRRAVTLSTTPAAAARWLVPRIAGLQAMHPGLDLHIAVTHAPVALDGLEADMAIRYGDGHWPGLHAEALFDNVFAPVCSPALRLRKPRDLRAATLLHFAPPGTLSAPMGWEAWQRRAGVDGLDVTAGPVFSDETHTVSAALDGHGVALMSIALVADELRAGSLVQPFGPTLDGKPFHLVIPQPRLGDPRLEAIRAWILSLPCPGVRDAAAVPVRSRRRRDQPAGGDDSG